ncbi:hypothetical protein D3C72_668990 [compost metagenome]
MAAPVVTAEMFIRRPVAEVFAAFVDPAVTTKFWFTRSSGPLAAGNQVEWFWDMYGVSALVEVKAVEPNRRILVEWGDPGQMTTVEWTFQDFGDRGTFVRITNSGFEGSPDELLALVADSAGGFHLVLAGLKAWLEHGIQLNLVGDKFPDEVRSA